MNFIVAPLWYGACKKGPDIGALCLVELFEKEGLSEQSRISIPNEAPGKNHLMPFFNAIDKADKDIFENVYSTLSSNNKVITIGGDHVISWGSISGVLNFIPNVGVIYLDAHSDCNIAEQSSTHHVHGMYMAYLMSYGEDKYVRRYTNNLLPSKNILYVGARSLDPYEVDLINENSLSIAPSCKINSNIAETLEIISCFMSRFQQIHICLDIDVLDPSIVPGTGVPEVDEMPEESLHKILTLIISKDKVLSVDIVEYNPIYDIDERTDKVA